MPLRRILGPVTSWWGRLTGKYPWADLMIVPAACMAAWVAFAARVWGVPAAIVIAAAILTAFGMGRDCGRMERITQSIEVIETAYLAGWVAAVARAARSGPH